MGIKDSFCPRCGRPSDGICEFCRMEGTPWATIEPRISCTYCPTCGAIREKSTWVQTGLERSALIESLVAAALRVQSSVRDLSTTLSYEDWSSNRTGCRLQVRGVYRGEPVQEHLEVEIAWKGELCTRCSRMSGGYYEGVVQVRAKGRRCSEREKEIAVRTAYQGEASLREGGDPLSFIARVEEVHHGIDIVVGTQAMGRSIAQEILRHLGGTLTTHPKLVGEKDGIPVYRVTYAVRLPFYQRGDVVEIQGTYGEVRESDGKRVTLFDLQRGEPRILAPQKDWRRLGNVHDALEAIVAYREGGVGGLVDPRNGITREVRIPTWLDLPQGERVRVLPDDERETLIVVG